MLVRKFFPDFVNCGFAIHDKEANPLIEGLKILSSLGRDYKSRPTKIPNSEIFPRCGNAGFVIHHYKT